MPERVKWGVIGSGGIARRRTIPEGLTTASNARLVAVYDVNQAANQEVARQFDAAAASSLGELLAADVDAVYIATPVHLHCQLALQCFRAGKHVLCEKPLGMDVAEARTMLAAAAQARLHFGAAFMMPLHSQHRAALKLVEEGKLGKLVYARGQLSCWYPAMEGAWRQHLALGGGGSLIDMGNHCINLLEMFLGPVERVSCFVNRSVQDYESEDSAVAMLRFASGAMATVDAFFCIPDASSRNRLELYGSRGSILAENTIGQAPQGHMQALLETGETIDITPTPVNTYRAEIEEFSQAILENRPSSLSGEAGLHSQKVMAACYESARSGQAVTV
jgi:predicted dehydrogenase